MTEVYSLGTRVEKIKGYKWPGIVVAVFHNTKGDLRYIVECTVPAVEGALHIYAPEQLQRAGLEDEHRRT